MSDNFNEQDGVVVPKPKRKYTRRTKRASFKSPVTRVKESQDASTATAKVSVSNVGKPSVVDVTVEVVEENVYVGFSEFTQEWYGWRNNLVAKGFKQGDRLDAAGLPEGFVANNLEQARKLAVAYARTA